MTIDDDDIGTARAWLDTSGFLFGSKDTRSLAELLARARAEERERCAGYCERLAEVLTSDEGTAKALDTVAGELRKLGPVPPAEPKPRGN